MLLIKFEETMKKDELLQQAYNAKAEAYKDAIQTVKSIGAAPEELNKVLNDTPEIIKGLGEVHDVADFLHVFYEGEEIPEDENYMSVTEATDGEFVGFASGLVAQDSDGEDYFDLDAGDEE